jgi:hypothetical protein
MIIDPRITAQDLDESLRVLVTTASVNEYDVQISARVNFLTFELLDQRGEPTILWVPYTSLLPAMAEVSKRAGC